MLRVLRAFIVVLCAPAALFAQSVTLGGSANVASADDFASRSFQDPWEMNERTDLGWHLNGVDGPLPNLTNVSFSGGVFSGTTTTANESNVFLLETSIIGAAHVGKIGPNHPIDASTYRVLAIHMNVTAPAQARLLFYRESIYDVATTTYSGFFPVTPGWRTYIVSIPGLGIAAGPLTWSGLIKSLQLTLLPPSAAPVTWQIDWVRLVTQNATVCRQVSWSGFAGAVDLYIDPDGVTNGNESLLEDGVVNNTGSGGCSPTGTGYNFAAGALPGGSYYLLARPAGSGSGGARSASAYQVNTIPLISMTSPSEEGSSDDFATTFLGNPWDMNALSDVDVFFNVSGQTITTIPAETAAGTPLGNVRVLSAQNGPPTSNDPILALLWTRPARIDPIRYRILTIEYGLPNFPRWISDGAVFRVIWRVAGDTAESGSAGIIINSRVGANVMDKFVVDMADRNALPLDMGSPLGWVPGNSSTPGIVSFRLDIHEFPQTVPFFVRRVKLASFERVPPGTNYTIRWTASEASGTVTLYYDADKNPANGMTLIGSATASAGSRVWTAPNVGGNPAYYIYAVIDDGQGNSNAVYSRWPVIVGAAFAPGLTAPTGFRIVP
jgi:Ser-Thr-rich glycosyl-phosphatidyl-inositol-anchored membrane family